MDNQEKPHLTDEQLLLHADGELLGADGAAAQDHLDACWSCRARLDDLQTTINKVVRFRNEVLLPSMLPPPTWPGLQPRLQALKEELRRQSIREIISGFLASRPLRLALSTALTLVILAAVFFWPRTTVVSAKELLTRSQARPSVSAHRRLLLEESVSSRKVVVARREIDIWHNTRTGIKARRIYDDRRRLLAGEWTSANGTRTVYRPNAAPGPASSTRYEPNLDDLWRAEPSPADFMALVGGVEQARVKESASAYVVEWALGEKASPLLGPAGREPSGTGQLLAASLTLNKETLHPIAQTVEVLKANEVHEFRLTETVFTPVAPEAIPVAALEPDSELTGEAIAASAPASKFAPKSPTEPGRISPSDLIEIEMDVVKRLDGTGAFLGEQLTVERDPQRGELRVEGIVDSAERKQELLRALGPAAKHPSVVVAVTTIAEAAQEQALSPSRPTTARLVEVEQKPAPVHDDLRRYFLERRKPSRDREGADVQVDPENEIQRFTLKVMERSLQARLHARALKQVVGRFSLEEVRNLSAEARKNWHDIIRRHASAFQRETEQLRSDLQPIFFPDFAVKEPDSALPREQDLAQAVQRLFELGSSHDAIVARTFSLSVDDPKPEPPRWDSFYRSLKTAEQLAAQIKVLVSQ